MAQRKFLLKPMLSATDVVEDILDKRMEEFIDEDPNERISFIDDFRDITVQILNEYFGVSSKEELQEQINAVNILTEKAKAGCGKWCSHYPAVDVFNPIFDNKADNLLTVKNSDIVKRIDTQRLCYVAVDCDCSSFYLDDHERFSCSKSLNEIKRLLPPHFIQIRRNCLVSIPKISEFYVKHRKIVLLNGTKLEVSHRNMKTLIDTLTKK